VDKNLLARSTVPKPVDRILSSLAPLQAIFEENLIAGSRPLTGL
jgi:hypothetical protein